MNFETDWLPLAVLRSLLYGMKISKNRPLIMVAGRPFFVASEIVPQVIKKARADHHVRSLELRKTVVFSANDRNIYIGAAALSALKAGELVASRTPNETFLDQADCDLLARIFLDEATSHFVDEADGDGNESDELPRLCVGIFRRDLRGYIGRQYRQVALADWLFEQLIPNMGFDYDGYLNNKLGDGLLAKSFQFELGRFVLAKG